MGSGRGFSPIWSIFTVSKSIPKIFVIYNILNLLREAVMLSFLKLLKLQMPLPNAILSTKYQQFYNIIIALYRFSLNGILWAWQCSKSAHLLYQTAWVAKFYQNFWIFTQVIACNDRMTDKQTVARNSIRHVIIIIYICSYIYISISINFNNFFKLIYSSIMIVRKKKKLTCTYIWQLRQVLQASSFPCLVILSNSFRSHIQLARLFRFAKLNYG